MQILSYISMWFIILSLALFAFLVIHFIVHIHKPAYQDPDLPPGTMGWPILGENLEFISSNLMGTPEKFIQERVKKYSSHVFKTSIFSKPTVFFCGPAANKFVFHNQGTLFDIWWPESIRRIFPTQHTFNEENKKLRTLLPAFFKSDSIKSYVSIMDSMTKHHLENYWEDQNEMVVSPLIMKCTFMTGCRLLASIEDESLMAKLEDRMKVVSIGALCFPYNIPGTPLHDSIASSSFIRNEFLGIIKQRKADLIAKKASSNQDILSAMLTAIDDKGKFLFPNENDISSLILILLSASFYTSTSTLTFLMKYLGDHPRVYDQVRKEQIEITELKARGEELKWEDLQKMKYSWSVVCEVLRLVPPLQGMSRAAIVDFSFGGYRIPKGWKIFWSASSTHLDPKYFPDPKKFDPSRFEGNGPAPFTFVAFGGGPHMCPGMQYARCQILIFLHHVVTKFKWENILLEEKVVFDPLPQPEKGLPVQLYPNLVSA